MKVSFTAMAVIMLCGCSTLAGTGITSASDIARDAAALNDAYNRAASGQILLNVLRSRDRWPRQYVTLNAMTNQPTATASGTLTLDAIPLGVSEAFEGSNAELRREQHSAYNYGITPMTTADITNAVLTPVKRSVFAHYWNSSWAEDVLLLVMASGMQRYTSTSGKDEHGALSETTLRRLRPSNLGAEWGPFRANRPLDDDVSGGAPCLPDVGYLADEWPTVDDDGRCAFFRITHRMYDHIVRYGSNAVRLQPLPEARCRESEPVRLRNAEAVAAMAAAAEASGGQLVMRLQRPANENDPDPPATPRVVLARCPPDSAGPVLLQVMRGDGTENVAATYLVSLRSLDDMTFAMGVLLRPTPAEGARYFSLARVQPCHRAERQAARQAYRAAVANGQPATAPREAVDNCVTASLFRIEERDRRANAIDYAAYVDYRGKRVVAGPPVRGNDNDVHSDRTATVLTLLSQLFALNFSPGASAPAPVRVNTN